MFYADACKSRYNRNKKRVVVVSYEVKPILRYPGAKWSRAAWIVEQLPPFRTYVEPFFGSGAVFFSLPSVPDYAVLNDKSMSVVNLFEMIRTRGPELCAQVEMTPWARDEYDASFEQTGDPLEAARRFLVRCWQAHGTKTNIKTGWRNCGHAGGSATYTIWNQVPDRIACVIEKLKYAEIENRDALDVIARFSDQEDCLMYVDPPYVLSTRSGALYEHEMGKEQEHIDLLNALDKHVGPVVLSGYANSLYDERLKHWQRVTSSSLAESGKKQVEVLWLNEKAKSRQLNLFDTA